VEYASFLPPIATEYLDGRGIDADAIARWEIGWHEDEKRITLPAKDLNGQTRFLILRAVKEGQQPKYLYKPEGVSKNSLLFGACNLNRGLIRSFGLVIVEGSLDAVKISSYDLPTVAILGTGISPQQCGILSRLRPRRIYLLFDKDSSGVRNIEIAAKKLREQSLWVCRYPHNRSDPAELHREEALRSVDRAMSISKFKRQNPGLFPNVTQRGVRVG
jgi:DNA primase